MSLISIRNVSKSFGGEHVLKDINLDVEAGTFVTLLGPSGCGKTTLLRIIAGLETPDEGSVYAGNRCFVDIAKGVFAAPQERKLGFVFQDYGLWPHLSVAQNVAFPLKMAKMKKNAVARRVAEVLAAVRLSAYADKRPEKLSGGQKQRVSIARALAAKPGLILFDEPLSNLDANLREELGREIRMLSKHLGLTCINVTHDRREAQLLSERIALMKDGVIHQWGSPEELFRTPKDVWTAAFLDAGNILPGEKVLRNAADGVQILVPRGAFTVADATGESVAGALQARVLNCLYLDDRYEITAEIDGMSVKIFSSQPFLANQCVTLTLKENEVIEISGSNSCQ